MIKKQIAIDFGGGFLRIYEKNVGFVFAQPALIAVEKRGKKYAIVATGDKAEAFQDENNLLVFSPIAEGVIQSVEYATALLKRALVTLYPQKHLSGIFAFVAVPSGLDAEEKTKFLKTCANAGLGHLDIADSTVCALLGTDVNPETPVLMIDLGATKCDFQILKNFEIQKSATLGLGANSIQNAIIQTLWEDMDLYITPQTAKDIQTNLCSLFSSDAKSLQITAIHTKTKEAITKTLMAQKVHPIAKGFFEEVALVAKTMLEETHPNKVESIIFSGGLANITGLEKFMLKHFPNVQIIIPQNPENCVLVGLSKLI